MGWQHLKGTVIDIIATIFVATVGGVQMAAKKATEATSELPEWTNWVLFSFAVMVAGSRVYKNFRKDD